MVSGCVGFVGVFARTFGPSRSGTGRFVRKVSSFFQVVAGPCETTNVLDLAWSNPVERGQHFRNERCQIRNAIGRSSDNHDTKRENGDVLLVFEIAIHRHQGIDQAALRASAERRSWFPPNPELARWTEWPIRAPVRSCGRFSSSSTRTCHQALARELERGDGLFASNGWKLPEKVVEGIATLDVVEQRLNRDPGAHEHGRSAQNLRVAMYDWRFVGHGPCKLR